MAEERECQVGALSDQAKPTTSEIFDAARVEGLRAVTRALWEIHERVAAAASTTVRKIPG
jgi:hypothetical protein